jgi:hypothetical protein
LVLLGADVHKHFGEEVRNFGYTYIINTSTLWLEIKNIFSILTLVRILWRSPGSEGSLSHPSTRGNIE